MVGGAAQTDDPAGFLPALIAAADEAGEAVMTLYGKAGVRWKDDRSPVTAADERAEAIILRRLDALAPALPVVAEERVSRGAGPGAVGDRFWLVDPLDGTREFLSGNGEFTVNIALVDGGKPTLAVVGVPAMDLLYASDGTRAFRRRGGDGLESIRARRRPAGGVTAAVSRSHRDAETDAFLGGLTVADERARGSALKFCLLAEGEADVYPRFGRTMEWDTAAGHGVLRAAGGAVRKTDGSELDYGKPGFENPPFIAWGRDG